MKYRIEQINRNTFKPQYLQEQVKKRLFLKPITISKWIDFSETNFPYRNEVSFTQLKEAESYIDDDIKYPLIHKYP